MFVKLIKTKALPGTLFVFMKDGPRQNAGSLLTPVSNTAFCALSQGTLGFAFHGSFIPFVLKNLIGC